MKMGLGVNKATQTDLSRRRVNEALFKEIGNLGSINSSLEKSIIKEWIHNCLDTQVMHH